MTEVIDDLIVLGRSGPELISDRRHTVCLGGWSPERGFIRIYPTHMYSEAQRWNIIKVPVENGDDFRDESWKIEGSEEDWDILHEKIIKRNELERNEQIELLKDIPKTCPHKLNEQKESLGIVDPETIHDAYLKENDNEETVQKDLQGHELKSKNSYPYKVYIKYTCSECGAEQGYHEQHCMEWGIYQWWDKNPGRPEQVIENLRILDENWRKHFFIGNLKNNPTSFVVISVLRHKKTSEQQARETHKTLDDF